MGAPAPTGGDVKRLEAQLVVQTGAELGESPLWDERARVLRWMDGAAGLVHSWDPATRELDSIELSEPIAAIGLRAGGGLLIVHRRHLVLLEPDGELCTPPLAPDERLNDGAVDRFGTYWVGSVHDDGEGHVYRVHPDGTVDTVLSGIGMSNGIDWSPSGDAMYYVDTRSQRIDELDVDPADGAVAERRPFVEIPRELGLPDGLTVDEEGGVWLAIWGASQVRRYLPDGSLNAVVEVPAQNSSSCTFGGEDLRTLYITSAREGLSPEELSNAPDAGALFAVEVPVRGRAANRFAM